MTLQSKQIGQKGELLAQQFLQKKGYQIVDKNFCLPGGQIDLIVRKNFKLHFIEVKTTTLSGPVEDIIKPRQIRKLRRAALSYLLHQNDLPPYWQFDLLHINLSQQKQYKKVQVTHYLDIFAT